MNEQEQFIEDVCSACPFSEEQEAYVWKAAVRMLALNGAILCPVVASVRFPKVSRERAEALVQHAVVSTRAAFETAHGRLVSVECNVGDPGLAGKVFCL